MVNQRTWEAGVGCGRGPFDSAAPGHALPGDRPQWPRDRVADPVHLRLDLTLDVPGKRVHGTASHRVRAINDGLASVSFDAIAFRIGAVRVDGAPARYSYDGETLTVRLPQARKRGETFEVAIDYEARPRLGLYFIGPDEAYPDKPPQAWTQGQDDDSKHWFPCSDHPSTNAKQTSELIVTVPGSWYALSNGTLVGEEANRDGTRTFHWSQERPHSTYLITLAAGEFARIDASTDRLTIDYFVEQDDVEDARRSFANTPRMVDFFERVTGVAYPWAKYSQVVVRDFIFGGMENTSATTMTRNILIDRKASVDFDADYLVSHELAHMWFGDLLTCRDWSHGWLNESFATFLELLWDEERLGLDEYRQGVVENTRRYLEERYRRPIVSNVYRDPINIFDRHLYEKGSVVLHMLRALLGDDQFFRAIQRYTREHQDQTVITQDLADAIEAETGRQLGWFFEQWVFRPGHPKLKVSWSWDEATSAATVRVRQTQDTADGTPIFRFPVTVDFTTGRGRPKAFRVEVTEAEQAFVFPLAAKPDLCRFDPHNEILKEIDFEKSSGELRLQLRSDDDIAGRQAAAEALGKKGGPEAVAALEAAAMGDRYWAVQAAAAKALGVVGTIEARDALIRCLKVRQPKARRAVVAALGEFRGDRAAFEGIRPLAARDASWFVEAEAHRTAGKLRVDGAFELIERGMARRSFREVVRQGCIDGLVELREARGLALLEAAARYGEPAQARAPAVTAIGKLAGMLDGQRASAADTVAGFLRDPDFRVRVAAAGALRELRADNHLGELDAMAARELDGRGVRAAREAALQIRKGLDVPAELKGLREEFEQLKGENTRLRERLEKVEAARARR
jgi:aminopeptidase N